jgi:hypothetical protein
MAAAVDGITEEAGIEAVAITMAAWAPESSAA